MVGQACGSNPAGTRTKLYLIPAAELDGFPALKTSTGAGDTMTLSEPFDFVTTVGKGYWREFDILQDTGSVVDTLVGEIGGKAYETVVNGHFVGVGAPQLETLNSFSNTPMVAIIQDRKGVHRVIGRDDDPAYLDTAEATTGQAIADRRGITFSIKAVSGSPAPVYDAATDGINLTPNA